MECVCVVCVEGDTCSPLLLVGVVLFMRCGRSWTGGVGLGWVGEGTLLTINPKLGVASVYELVPRVLLDPAVRRTPRSDFRPQLGSRPDAVAKESVECWCRRFGSPVKSN